jgi:hypothetical protein
VAGQDVDLAEPTAARFSTGPELAPSDMDKDARIEAMRSEIDRELDELSDPEGWARYLEAVSRSSTCPRPTANRCLKPR